MSVPGSIPSSLHRSHSDRDLAAIERRITRARLNSSSSFSHVLASPNSGSNRTGTTSGLATVSAPIHLPWDRLEKWLYGIAVLTFDLEHGQSIEFILPKHCKLSEQERTNISFLSFPDVTSKCLGDLQYHFRINHESTLSTFYKHYNTIVPAALQVDQSSLFGYVNFRQIRLKTVKRGYLQKSVVVLSKLPFISLFLSVAHHLAVHYFEHGSASLEACCDFMDQHWPEPEPGKSLHLYLLENILQVRIPTQGDKPFSSSDLLKFRSIVQQTITQHSSRASSGFPIDDGANTSESPSHSSTTTRKNRAASECRKVPLLIPFVHDVNTYQSLSGVLTHIQLLWELVLLNEPMAILGNFPTNCSQTVQALVHIIWPLRYASDYRPFFTIHSSEFQGMTFNASSVLPSIIIGVTNPFFSKLLHQWPHVIRIDDTSQDQLSSKPRENFLLVERDDDKLSVNELEDSTELPTASSVLPKLGQTKFSTHSKPFKRPDTSSSKDSSHLTFHMKPGLYTKYRPYLQRDKAILKKLQSSKSQQRPDTVQNAILRRFFLELTQSFLIPLERYFVSLLPLRKHYFANRKAPLLKDFDREEFIRSLGQYGPKLTSGLKGDWKELYKHFFSTANFRLWLWNRQREANAKIDSLHIETIANCRLKHDLQPSLLTEIELIDLLIKFQGLIQRLESSTDEMLFILDRTIRRDYGEKLRTKMRVMIEEYLSEDMKVLFFKTIKVSSI